jgi:dihydrofolate reductase
MSIVVRMEAWPSAFCAAARSPSTARSGTTATAQLALAAGTLEELEIHLIPLLLGQGRRLFDHLDPEHIELERTRVLEGDGVTHLHYRVRP